jgi:hypothetical protein
MLSAVLHHGGAGTAHTLGLGPRPISWRTLKLRPLTEVLLALTRTPAYRTRARSFASLLQARDGAEQLAQLVLDRASQRDRSR